MNKQVTELDDFDFGFSFATEDEMEAFKELDAEKSVISQEATTWRQKAHAIRDAIEPLLTNLCADAEREYIKWPNRVDKINQFRRHLDKIIGES